VQFSPSQTTQCKSNELPLHSLNPVDVYIIKRSPHKTRIFKLWPHQGHKEPLLSVGVLNLPRNNDNSQIINGIHAFKNHLNQHLRKLDRMTRSPDLYGLTFFDIQEQFIIFASSRQPAKVDLNFPNNPRFPEPVKKGYVICIKKHVRRLKNPHQLIHKPNKA
jgi:hypothetical protein